MTPTVRLLGASPWRWEAHPDVWLLMAALLGGYAIAARHLGPRYVEPGERPVKASQTFLFAGGVFALWLASDWPIHDLAERYLYSVHMVQHLLISLVAPPLLLAGTPDWLARWLLRPKWLMRIARRITHPIPALLLFNAVLVLSHWPAVVDYTLFHHWSHFLAHVVLFASGVIMWWPVLSPLPELPRIASGAQLLYLFLQTIIPTVPASFLTFASHTIYRFYDTVPRILGLSAVEDQSIAGMIMKVGGGFFLWAVIAGLFFRWAGHEEKPAEPTVQEWHQMEREINEPRRAS